MTKKPPPPPPPSSSLALTTPPPQVQPNCRYDSAGGDLEEPVPWQRQRSARVSAAAPPTLANCAELVSELTVCDIIGDWGLYQWNICLFSVIYSALSAVVVVFGPILTPEMAHICATDPPAPSGPSNSTDSGESPFMVTIPADKHECFVGISAQPDTSEGLIADDSEQVIVVKCTSFIYNQLGHGLMLTNGFDLVCDRRWLRSLVSSSVLVGMLISSITLGLFSDKFGRLRCVQVGFVISCLANVVSLVARDYFLFCACIGLMSFAQIGAANALCTLSMEATSPRFRYAPVFQYGAGWSLGAMFLPLLNDLLLDYRLLMGALLIWQLLMLPWLHWGIFESIRWLLSEGHFNKAQIELRRACRMNNVKADTKLAQSIARIEVQQVRKASRVIEHELAPMRLSQALGANVDETTRELELLNSAIRKSFLGEACQPLSQSVDEQTEKPAAGGAAEAKNTTMTIDEDAPPPRRESSSPPTLDGQTTTNSLQHLNPMEVISPTLSRMSFSLPPIVALPGAVSQDKDRSHSVVSVQANGNSASNGTDLVKCPSLKNGSSPRLSSELNRRGSLTTQGLIQLAMKYSKKVQREEEGQCFIVQMFHRKLWRQSLVLLLVSVVFETSYYGLIQANKFVGDSINLNYVTGALGDLAASLFTCILLAFVSRRTSLSSCTLLASLVCFGMALSYQLIPDITEANHHQESRYSQLQPYRSSTSNWTNTTSRTTTPPTPPSAMEHLVNNDALLEPINPLRLQDEPTLSLISTEANESATRMSMQNRAILEVYNNDRIILRRESLVQLRQTINFYLMNAGKFIVSSGIQVGTTISMEAYPNNLRQTGSGVILSAGRIGSILAPFLFDDTSPDKHVFKLTLVVLGCVGFFVCILIPVTIRDQKDKELCDQLNEFE